MASISADTLTYESVAKNKHVFGCSPPLLMRQWEKLLMITKCPIIPEG